MTKPYVDPYLLLELANCHGGDVDYIRQCLREIKTVDTLARGVKFQIFSPKHIAMSDYSWYATYEKLFIEEPKWSSLIAEASVHCDVWIDIFDAYGVQVLECNKDKITGIKLQSSVIENLEVVDALKNADIKDLHVLMNVSGHPIENIAKKLQELSELCPNLILQIGFQSYPTEISDTALAKIKLLRQSFPNNTLSIADHADATSDFAQLVPIHAFLLGCKVIEKHFCIDRKTVEFDGFSAIEPFQLKTLCQRLEQLKSASAGDFISKAEDEYLKSTLQIPLTKSSIPKGVRIDLEHLKYRRTNKTGMLWSRINEKQLLGYRLKKAKSRSATILEADFDPARVGVLIACRMKSTRLPKKTFSLIGDMPALARCIMQCKMIPGVDDVVVATSDLVSDKPIVDFCQSIDVDCWTGDPDDVIYRYLTASKHYDFDLIVRVTADCPFVSYEIAEHLIQSHFENGADFTCAKDFAVGTACEVIEVSSLRKIIDKFGAAPLSEYMSWYFNNNPDYFAVNQVTLPRQLVRDYRLTLDYPEDLECFNSLCETLGSTKSSYSIYEIFEALDKNPWISLKNSHIELKYKVDGELIKLLNSETKITADKK